MSKITFKTKLFNIKDWVILKLPQSASAKLPSRGQVMVSGTINGFELQTPLEPDGNNSHWMRITNELSKTIKANSGDDVTVSFELLKTWPEPKLPDDFNKVLNKDLDAKAVWDKATPMAHWEWVRWMRSTNKIETRNHRLEVALSKLRAGERRPCCWNRNFSSEPEVTRAGRLMEPN